MRATGVITRFLSLLDVALLLLGVLMIALMHAQLRSATAQGQHSNPLTQVADFVCVYAGWKGQDNGKCFLLGPDLGIAREIRTDTPDEIKSILTTKAVNSGKTNQIVLLVFSDDGWYSAWDSKKIDKIKQTWKIELVPVYNVHIGK